MEDEKKKVMLNVCRVFPVTHSRAGEPTGFESKMKAGIKIHSIRHDGNNQWNERYKGIASGRKFLSVREWTGRPYNSEQREIARFDKIGLQRLTMTYSVSDAVPQCWVDDKQVSVEALAKNDGLTVEELIEWFFKKDNVFEGVIVHFTNYRY